MKKFLIMVLAGLLILVLAGCNEAEILEEILRDDVKLGFIAREIKGEEREKVLSLIDQIGKKLPDYDAAPASETVGSSGTAVPAAGTSSLEQTAVAASENNRDIGLEAAKAIALEKAGLQQSDVSFTKAKLEKNQTIYDIEFYSAGVEYDFEIHAVSGEILEYDRDGSLQSASAASSAVSLEEAKQIALADAGVSSADAVFSKAKEDRDDGRRVYELKFFAGRYSYEYEIDAATGAVLEADRD